MSQNLANRRKSQLFLNNISRVKNTYDELIQDKLKCGKFPLTRTGWIKIVAVILLLAALALFLGQSICEGTPPWYPYVFPISIGISLFLQLTLYVTFSVGITVKNPGFWIKTDIFTNLLLATFTIITSVITMTQCSEGIYRISNILGIASGIISLAGCAAIFLMYRYVEDDENYSRPQLSQNQLSTTNISSRKSIHA